MIAVVTVIHPRPTPTRRLVPNLRGRENGTGSDVYQNAAAVPILQSREAENRWPKVLFRSFALSYRCSVPVHDENVHECIGIGSFGARQGHDVFERGMQCKTMVRRNINSRSIWVLLLPWCS